MGRFVKNPVLVSGSAITSQIAIGTTSEQSDNPNPGEIRFNTTLNMLEFYNGVEYVQLQGGTNGVSAITSDVITLDGSTTNYTLSLAPQHERNILVYIEGVFQKHSTYNVSGTTLTVSVTGADENKVLTVLHGFDKV
jgi:hypothetical protein